MVWYVNILYPSVAPLTIIYIVNVVKNIIARNHSLEMTIFPTSESPTLAYGHDYSHTDMSHVVTPPRKKKPTRATKQLQGAASSGVVTASLSASGSQATPPPVDGRMYNPCMLISRPLLLCVY